MVKKLIAYVLISVLIAASLLPVNVSASDPVSVDFIGNGGTPEHNVINVSSGYVSFPDEPEREGWLFAGWNTAADGRGESFSSDTYVSASMSVYAQWIPDSWAVYVMGNGGSPEMKVLCGSLAGTPDLAAPVREGYKFVKYSTRPDGLGQDFTALTPVTGEISVFAIWEKEEYEITFVNSLTNETKAAKASVKGIEDYPDILDFFDFNLWQCLSAWKRTDGSHIKASDPVTSDITVTAEISKVDTGIYFYGNGGQPAMQYKPYSITEGLKEQPLSPTRKHYDFAGWYMDVNCTIPYNSQTEITKDPTAVYAKWIKKTAYDVIFHETGTNPRVFAVEGTEDGIINFPSAAKYGKIPFLGWFYNEEGAGDPVNENTRITGTTHVYSVFRPLITYHWNDGTSRVFVTRANPEDVYAYNEGYSFKGWNTEYNGLGTYFTKNTFKKECDLYAQWEKNETNYYITYIIDSTYSYDGNDITEYDYFNNNYVHYAKNAPVLINDNYKFLYWKSESGADLNGHEIFKGGDELAPSRDMTLRAVCQKNAELSDYYNGSGYDVYYTDSAGNWIYKISSSNYDYEKQIFIPLEIKLIKCIAKDKSPLLVPAKLTHEVEGIEYEVPVTGYDSSLFKNNGYISCVTLSDIFDNTIEYGLFENCVNLESVYIDAAKISNYAFSNCLSLKYVYNSSTIDEIGSYAFLNCYSLEYWVPFKNASLIGSSAFKESGVTVIDLCTAGTKIGSNAFEGCDSLSKLSTCQAASIGEQAFKNCVSLSSANLTGAEEILSNAFENCTSIGALTLPATLKTIGSSLFKDCINLESVVFDYKNDSVNYISTGMFENCYKLKLIKIPFNCVEIYPYAFKNCTGVTDIIFENSELYLTLGQAAFSGLVSLNKLTVDRYIDELGYDVFYGCNRLRSIYYTQEAPPALPGSSSDSYYYDQLHTHDFLYADEKSNYFKVYYPAGSQSWSNISPRIAALEGVYEAVLHHYDNSTETKLVEADNIAEAGNRLSESMYSKPRTDARFTGWYADQARTIPVETALAAEETPIDLYDCWNGYSVSVSLKSDLFTTLDTKQTDNNGTLNIASYTFDPSPFGYMLTGWDSDPYGWGTFTSNTTVFNKSTSIYADYAKKTYKFIFISNDDTNYIYNTTGIVMDEYSPGDSIYPFPQTPVKEGYTFKGWFDKNGTEVKYNSSRIIDLKLQTKNGIDYILCYAKWEKKEYEVTFNPAGGSLEVQTALATVDGLLSSNLPFPVKNSFCFTGYKSSGCYISADYRFTQNMALTAQWEGRKAIVFYNTNGGEALACDFVNINDNFKASELIPEKNGYIFTGWYKDAALTQKWDDVNDKAEANMVLFAGWQPDNKVTGMQRDNGRLAVTFKFNQGIAGCRLFAASYSNGRLLDVAMHILSLSDINMGSVSLDISDGETYKVFVLSGDDKYLPILKAFPN
jgi:uncharacterized repeat protein (TIGR02543 family)